MSLEIKLASNGEGAEIITAGGHSVNVPLDERLGGIVARMLHAQAQSSGVAAGLGTKAKPLQSMVDEWLARGGSIKRIEPRPASGSVEIDLSELEL